MSFAIIAPITVSKHPGADRLQLGTVMGSQVIVGMDVKTGDLGVFFPEGTQLSDAYAAYNDLIRRKNKDGSHAGGFFEANRRVRCQKFRGEKSEGYFAPLDSLLYAANEKQIAALKVGDRMDSVNGTPLCNKYYTPATIRARAKNTTKTSRRQTTMFHAHFDTDQLKYHVGEIKRGSRLTVTLKMHGTSQRTGYVQDAIKLPLWKRLVNYIRPTFATQAWTYLTGSRNVILDRKPQGDGILNFRTIAAKNFEGKLHKGETVFYEIVGYEGLDTPIMQKHRTTGLRDRQLTRKYGDEITYSYGCQNGFSDVYVYRITLTNEDGYSFDLPWEHVKSRCEEIGVKHVPEMSLYFPRWQEFDSDAEYAQEVMGELDAMTEGDDPVGKTHPREGVCLRIEGEGQAKAKIYKHKGFTFGLLEGYIRDDAEYVDAEEIA